MDRLKGKIAVITGSGSGIGLAAAKLFEREGAYVFAASRYADEKELKEFDGIENIFPVKVDITVKEDLERLMDEVDRRFGRLDIVCNVAGINDLHRTLDETDDECWDRIMDTDLKAPFRICKLAIPRMLKSGGGAIVNIGSYAGLRGNHGPSYTAAKTGLIGLTKSLAFGYGPQGIRCNIINPGAVNTDIALHSGGEYQETGMNRIAKIVDAYPYGWNAEPEDVANACLYLCSDEAKYVNGTELSVDGGASCC